MDGDVDGWMDGGGARPYQSVCCRGESFGLDISLSIFKAPHEC